MRNTRFPLDLTAILAVVFAAPLVGAAAAQASVEISTAVTSNMSCSGGVCSPTAKNAVLNVNDLAGMLASEDVKITTGNGAVTIAVAAPFSWTSAHRLTLDAKYNVSFRAAVTVAGQGAVTIAYNNGGSGGDLLFFEGGKLELWDKNSSLIVNNIPYVLITSVSKLAGHVKKAPGGAYALAADYDASVEGTRPWAAARTTFTGTFEGLGNAISNLAFQTIRNRPGELFQRIGSTGVVRDLHLVNETIAADRLEGSRGEGGLTGDNEGLISGVSVGVTISATNAYDQAIGAIAGHNWGTIRNSSATGAIATPDSTNTFVGGLVGQGGSIIGSHASVSVQSADYGGGLVGAEDSDIYASYATGSTSGKEAGGLVGHLDQGGTIDLSFATGPVSALVSGGGLVGSGEFSPTAISNSYSTGAVTGATGAKAVGSLVGTDFGDFAAVYGTGQVTAPADAYAGGLVGNDTTGANTAAYWDLDTTGIADPSQGAGNIPNDPGITGLTDAQLKARLPKGFSRKIWRQNATTNNGYPYLRANPPPE